MYPLTLGLPLLVLAVLTLPHHLQALGLESDSRLDLTRSLLRLFPYSLLSAPVMPLVSSDSHSVPVPALVPVLARSTQIIQVYSTAPARCLSSGTAVVAEVEAGREAGVVVAAVEVGVGAEAGVVEVVLPKPLLLRGLVD